MTGAAERPADDEVVTVAAGQGCQMCRGVQLRHIYQDETRPTRGLFACTSGKTLACRKARFWRPYTVIVDGGAA